MENESLPPSTEENQKQKNRIRVTRACDFCRRKKVKCTFQEGQVCYNCQAYGEKCEFTKVAKKRGPQRGYAEDLEERIEEMEKAIKKASQEKRRKKDIITDEIVKNKTLIQRRFRPKDPPKKPPPGLLSNLFEEYGVLDPRAWPSGVSYDNVHYLGDLSTLQFFSTKLDYNPNKQWQGHQIKKFGDDVVLVADSGLANSKSSKIPIFQWPENIHDSGENIHKYIYTITGIDQYTAVRLLKIYFSHIHPILPVINKIEFLNQYRDRRESYPSGELINAMFGAAARYVECESLDPTRKNRLPADAIWDIPVGWSSKFFDQAEFIISKWSTTPTTSMVQAIILILNHRGDRNSKSSACWQLGGFAIRLAQLLGLHRNCDDWDIPYEEKQTRKRLWWALYITDRFQTAILGRPINLRDEDIDVSYPDAGAGIEEVMDAFKEDKERIQNNEVFPRFPSLTVPYDLTKNHNTRPHIYELFIQFIKLSQILGRIIQGLHTPMAKKYSSEHGSDSLVARLDYELKEWRNDFPKSLKEIQLPDFDVKDGHFAPAIASVLLFYFSTLILLHQPFIRRTMSRSSYSSQQICSSAATRGMRIASRFTVNNFLMCPYLFTLYPIMQFGLIHMYNSKNPNAAISVPAKYYLQQGTQLLARLRDMSFTASRMYSVFTSIMENADLQAAVDDQAGRNLAEEETYLEENIRRFKARREQSTTNNGSEEQETQSSMEHIMDFIMLSDPTKMPGSDDSASIGMTPVPVQQPIVPNSNDEAFTLSQFGFDTTYDSAALDYILNNVDNLYDFQSQQQPQQKEQPRPFELSLNHSNQPLIFDQTTEQTSQNQFRNDPNNIFWNLPFDFSWDQLNNWINNVNNPE